MICEIKKKTVDSFDNYLFVLCQIILNYEQKKNIRFIYFL